MPAPRVLVVLFDAMDQDLARRLAREGRMPTLAGLLERSSHAPTAPPDPFYVGGIWPAFATSVGAATHGQYCWRQFDPATYREPDAPYDYGQLDPFWAMLDRAGHSCLVLDVPRTFKVPLQHSVAVHDYLLHDPLPPGVQTTPAGLATRLPGIAGASETVACDTWPRTTVTDVRAIIEHLTDRMDRKVRAFETLMDEGDHPFAIVGFAESHCAGHQLWHYHDAGHPKHKGDIGAAMGDPLERVYAALDAALARVLTRADDNTRVMVVMSHGMGPHYDGSHMFDELVRRAEPQLGSLRRLTTGERLMGWRMTRNLAAMAMPSLRKRFRRWGYRAAFPVSNNEAWAGVRINLEGREQRGRVPASDRAVVQQRLIEFLESVRHVESGEPAFGQVRRVEDVVRGGPMESLLPDVVAQWRRDLGPYHALDAPGIGRISARDTAHRTGDHAPTGYAIVTGSDTAPGALDRTVSVCALAPTFCHWLGVELPQADEPPAPEWASPGVR